MEHLDSKTLGEFLQGSLDQNRSRDVVRHLLTGCESCKGLAATVWPSLSLTTLNESQHGDCLHERPSIADEASIVDRVFRQVREREQALSVERETAQGLAETLRPHPLARQLLLIENSTRFHTWGLCELLLGESWASRFDDAQRTLECARAAIAVAERLNVSVYGEALVNDLRARAWAYYANAFRIKGDYREAEDAYSKAERWLDAGTQDPLEVARYVQLLGSLRIAQARYHEARVLADRLISIYRRAGSQHQLGQALSQKGIVCSYLGDDKAAIELVEESLGLLDPAIDLRWVLSAHHNLIHMYQDVGDLSRALTTLQETKPLFVQLGDRLNLLRMRRVEGKIATELGQLIQAEKAYLEARNGFLAEGMGHDAAEISLELASLYLSQGRNAEACQLAEQLVPIFQSKDIQQGAVAAMIVFRRAALANRLSEELVGEILRYLTEAREGAEAQA